MDEPLDDPLDDAAHDHELIPAATVLLLRDHPGSGLQVLMLRRNSKIAFGGAWVFPGGRVDDHEHIDGDVVGAARIAAVREVEEETGLQVAATELETWSHWIPPKMPAAPTRGPRRRFSTWFFATAAPGGEVAIDHGEIHEHRWLTPAEALAQQRAREIELVPPTWVTLSQLHAHRSVDDAMAWARATEPELFRTRPLGGDPVTIAWFGDAAYEGASPAEHAGPRHRLVLDPEGWRYERS